MTRRDFILYAKNFMFGAEDSLVSTVGMLTGVTAAGISRHDIVLSGIVLICVEAFSMSVGSYLSETATEESPMDVEDQGHRPWIDACIMFFSYFVCGLVPLSPYIFLSVEHAFWWSIAASLVALVVLGVVSARILNINKTRNPIRMFAMGGLAIGFGVLIGMLFK